MTHRASALVLWAFCLCLCVGACAADRAAPGAQQEEAAGAPADDSRDEDEDGIYGEPDASSEVAEDDDPYTLADPEEALAAIPAEMRPADLLDAMKNKLLVPNVRSGGRAIFTDVVTIEPGQDITLCTFTDVITEGVTHLHDTRGSQTRYGHHAILQYLTTPQEIGTRECPDNSDLDAQLGQVLGGTGGEGTAVFVLPNNVVTEIPAGSQLVLNHHWINVGDDALEAQAEIITIPPDSEDDLVIARAMTILATDFDVPAGEHGETSTECTFDREFTLLSMLGHQHQWGIHVRADHIGDTETMIFDHDFDPDMISQPLTKDYALDDPYRFAAGDMVRMTCQWRNTSDAALIFPREMCVLFGWQIGADKDSICYNGSWL